MFINSESSMEEFIASDPVFTQEIADSFVLRDVELVGRQVNVGVKNRIDILYKGISMLPRGGMVLVAVELKYRPLETKDFAQIGRYKSALEKFFDGLVDVRCALVGTGVTEELAHSMNGQFYDPESNTLAIIRLNTSVKYEDVTGATWDCDDISGPSDVSLLEIKKAVCGEEEDGTRD